MNDDHKTSTLANSNFWDPFAQFKIVYGAIVVFVVHIFCRNAWRWLKKKRKQFFGIKESAREYTLNELKAIFSRDKWKDELNGRKYSLRELNEIADFMKFVKYGEERRSDFEEPTLQHLHNPESDQLREDYEEFQRSESNSSSGPLLRINRFVEFSKKKNTNTVKIIFSIP